MPLNECRHENPLFDDFWQQEKSFYPYLPELVSAEDAVRQALTASDGLVVLSDAADATTSGAPGDSVWILNELMKHDWPREVLVTLVAPDVVVAAEQAGAGSSFVTSLGGILDDRFGMRLTFDGVVQSCFDAQFTMTGHIGKNMPIKIQK